MAVKTEAAALTVRTAALLTTPEAVAVMLEFRMKAPAFLPVAKPDALIVAAEALLEAHVSATPVMVPPNWSLAVAVNCWVPAAAIVAAAGATTMDVRIGAKPATVKTAVLLVTPEAEAKMFAVRAPAPAFLPVAKPEALIVAAAELLEFQAKATPVMTAPNWSRAVAVNCWAPAAPIVADAGVMAMDVRTGTTALTVKTAALLVRPAAEAVILEAVGPAPVLLPVAKPVALIAAAEGLLEFHVTETAAIAAPNWSLGVAMNC